DLDGTVTLAGNVRWNGKTLSPDITLTLKDVAFETPEARIQGVNGALHLTSLQPPATAPAQNISATIVVPGLPPAKLTLAGQLLAKPALRLDSLAVEIAGGVISAGGFTLDPAASNVVA